MTGQLDLFGGRQRKPRTPAYPDGPGFKASGTSSAAAEGIAPKAGLLRDRVLAEIRKEPSTPEEIALRLSVPLMNVRPRCSELHQRKLIQDSRERRRAVGGRQAIVWTVVPQGGEGGQ